MTITSGGDGTWALIAAPFKPRMIKQASPTMQRFLAGSGCVLRGGDGFMRPWCGCRLCVPDESEQPASPAVTVLSPALADGCGTSAGPLHHEGSWRWTAGSCLDGEPSRIARFAAVATRSGAARDENR